MCTAHTAVLDQMYTLLEDGRDITLRRGTTPANTWGIIDFASRVVTVNASAAPPQFTATLLHELCHLERGPCYEGDEGTEEKIVTEQATRLAVPADVLPSPLSAADPHRVALECGVDVDTARLGVELAMRDRREEGVVA